MITSRPTLEDPAIGTGSNLLRLTDDQLNLVVALVCHCRLGGGSPASVAALELAGVFSTALGDMAIEDAMMNLDLTTTIEDEDGNTIFTSISGYEVTLNV